MTLALPVRYLAELVMDRFENVHSRKMCLGSRMKETHRIKEEEEGEKKRRLMEAHPLHICVSIVSHLQSSCGSFQP